MYIHVSVCLYLRQVTETFGHSVFQIVIVQELVGVLFTHLRPKGLKVFLKNTSHEDIRKPFFTSHNLANMWQGHKCLIRQGTKGDM